MSFAMEGDCQELFKGLFVNNEVNDSGKDALATHLKNYKYVVVDVPLLLQVLSWTNQGQFIVICCATSDQEKVPRKLSGSQNCDEVVLAESSIENELEITGDPLECPFDLNDQTVTEDVVDTGNSGVGLPAVPSCLPVPTSKTCSLLKVVQEFLIGGRLSTTLPFAILCDAHDHNGTLFLGLHKSNGKLNHFRVSCNGETLTANKLPKLDTMKREHLFGILHTMIEMEVYAVYNILHCTNNVRGQSSIDVFCSWNDVCAVLELPSSDASCTVYFNVTLGDVRSGAHSKWQELTALEDLANGLVSDEVMWTVSTGTESSILLNIIDLLEGMKMSGSASKENLKPSSSDVELFIINRPRNMEFTDKLWDILRGCTNYNELVKSLTIVLETLQSGEIKPLIFKNNHTSFAQIVSDVVSRKAAIPSLTSVTPLRMLVEMGIEKLKQDYFCIFLNSNLVTRNNLTAFFSKDCLHWQHDLCSLRKLQCAIEMVSLCQTFINPSHTILGNYARTALSQLEPISKIEKSHSFTFAIDHKSTKAILERNSPLLWQISMTSRQNAYVVQTTYRMSTQHPSETSTRNLLSPDAADQTASHYYVCKATRVQDAVYGIE